MSTNTALRESGFLWFLRVFQCLGSLVVLAFAISNIEDWHELGCALPKQLEVNVAAVCSMAGDSQTEADLGAKAAITAPCLVYVILSTGTGRIRALPWSSSFQFFLDLTLLVVWIVPSSFASYTCSGICNTCKIPDQIARPSEDSKATTGYYIWVGRLTCSCYLSQAKKGGTLSRIAVTIRRNAYLRPGKGELATRVFRGVSRVAARRALDGVMIVLLLIAFMITAIDIYRKRSSGRRKGSLVQLRGRSRRPALGKNYTVSVKGMPSPSSGQSSSDDASGITEA